MKELRIAFTIIILSMTIIAPNLHAQELEAILIRADALKKFLKAHSYLDDQLRNIDSFNHDNKLKLRTLFNILNNFAKKEIITNPLDTSYQKNLDEFIENCEKIFPDIFTEKLSYSARENSQAKVYSQINTTEDGAMKEPPPNDTSTPDSFETDRFSETYSKPYSYGFDVLEILNMEVMSEDDGIYLIIIVSMKNSNAQNIRFRNNYFTFHFGTEDGGEYKIGIEKDRRDEIFFKAGEIQDLIFYANMGDYRQAFEAVTHILNGINSPLTVVLLINGRSEFGLQSSKGWSMVESMQYEWSFEWMNSLHRTEISKNLQKKQKELKKLF